MKGRRLDGEIREVIYSASRWRLLSLLRDEARSLLAALHDAGINAVVIGSVARGDVHSGSDIDVFVEQGVPYYMVENALLRKGYSIESVRIVKATPWSGLKVTYLLGGRRHVVLPVTIEGREEEEFPRYAGSIDLKELVIGKRVCGVSKQLYFIEPTAEGHREWWIVGREDEVAARLGISLETVFSRVRYRLRRYMRGKRGLYIDVTVPYGRHIAVLRRYIE